LRAYLIRLIYCGLETTMTTGKNNFNPPRTTVRGIRSAAQLRGEKEKVVFTSCFGCFKLNQGEGR
jgi:hypothetical protein